ncbi:FAD:protein FMN transferase [Phenylobacterium sp.]|uniref:FAD:protein FMN transferase n=1 Tax=Phenylobacterium sp. TaxID=1871053 RepID=UPI0035AE2A34
MAAAAPEPGRLSRAPEGWLYAFGAMASPCEVRLDCDDGALAERLGRLAEDEARRIEAKYSRYRPESLLSQINASAGAPVTVDGETAALIDYAAQCHALSGGLFDITSGVLRRVWRFDGRTGPPGAAEVAAVLPHVGWDKVSWTSPVIALPAGMEIDFGGLGKEYAVDMAVLRIQAAAEVPALVNFGGDLRVTGPRRGGGPWRVAIESVEQEGEADGLIEILHGALTTSGDTHRAIVEGARRYGHILDPRSGWPVEDPPRSVTVAAPTCLEAGLLSTLAMLHGAGAEQFLKDEGLQAWWAR